MSTTLAKRLSYATAIGSIGFAVLSWTVRQHPQPLLRRNAPTLASKIQTSDDQLLDSLSDQYSKLYAERKKLKRTAINLPTVLPNRFASQQQQLDSQIANRCEPVVVSTTEKQSELEASEDVKLKHKKQALDDREQLWRDSAKVQAKKQATKALDANGQKLRLVGDALGQKLRDKRKGFRFRLHGTTYQAYVADLEVEQVRMHLTDSVRKTKFSSLDHLWRFYAQQGITPAMLTNAGMFHANQEPVGLLVENGTVRGLLNTKTPVTDENFYLRPNGVFYVDDHNVGYIDSTAGFRKKWELPQRQHQVLEATQSGPMLVIDNKINAHFGELSANAKVRSGVGIINNNGNDGRRVVFLATIGESTFYDFATTFRELFGCANALFLDGAISRMYVDSKSAGSPSGGYFGPMLAVIPRQAPPPHLNKANASAAPAKSRKVSEPADAKILVKPTLTLDSTVIKPKMPPKSKAATTAAKHPASITPVANPKPSVK